MESQDVLEEEKSGQKVKVVVWDEAEVLDPVEYR